MALQVNFATATVDLVLNTSRFYRELARAHASLARFQGTWTVTLAVNAAPAHARINLVMQQLRAAQQAARITMTGGGGYGGRGGGGGPGFLSGVWSGAGLPYAASPAMMAGEVVGAGGRAAIGTAIKMQSSFADLRRIGGFGAEESNSLKKMIFESSISQSGVSVEDMIQIAQSGARAGVKGGPAGIAQYAKDVAMVKNAVGDMPTEELANRMVQVLNNFTLGTDRVKNFGSALVAMDNASTATARDILDITTRLSGTASQIKLTLPQVLALSATLKNVGLSNEVAGSSLSQIFRKMASDSGKFAAQIGVDASTFADAMRKDPMEALGMVINKLKELDDTIAGQEFIDSLGLRGVRVGGALQQLASKFGDVKPLTEQAAKETETLGALEAADRLKAETAEAAITKFYNALKILGDELGTHVLPFITDLTNALTAMVRTVAGGDTFGVLGRTALLGAHNVLGVTGFQAMNPKEKETTRVNLQRLVERTLYGAKFEEAGKPIAERQKGGLAPTIASTMPPQDTEPSDLAKAAFNRAAIMNRGMLGGAVLGGFGGGIESGLMSAVATGANTGAGVAGGGGNMAAEVGRKIWAGLAVAGETRGGLLALGMRGAGLVVNKVATDAEKTAEARKNMDFRSGFNAQSLSERIQDAIMNSQKDKHAEQTAKHTGEALPLLAQIKAAVERGAGGIAAVFGR